MAGPKYIKARFKVKSFNNLKGEKIMDTNEKWIKVRFNKSFRQDWIRGVAEIENMTPLDVISAYLTQEPERQSFKSLCDRLAGNVGFVQYDSGTEYFEKEDNNWAIPDSCFEFTSE